MNINKATEKQAWYSLPLHQNPKAIFPLYLAGFGSLSWQAVAIFSLHSFNYSQDHIWEVLILVGIVCMSLGFAGSFIYRHYRTAALALIVALISPPLWFLLLVGQFSHCFTWLPLPLPVSEYSQSHPVVIWLYFQISLAILLLWRSSWQYRVKTRATILAVGCLICFFIIITIQSRHEVALSPHISDEYLSSIYAQNDTAAFKRLTHKRIVVTGAIFGSDDGLIGGGGPYEMNSNIAYNDFVGNDSLTEGQIVSVIGTLEGRDAYGNIQFSDCRVVK